MMSDSSDDGGAADEAGTSVGSGATAPEGKRRRRGIYLLPNLITTAALFAGFYAIVAAVDGNFPGAGWAIFIAMLLDAADGRIARLTNTQSQFGAEYDSLSDMIAFGAAPAFVAFFFALVHLGKLGWVATFIYIACAALRLARFNTVSGDDKTFTGLASPSAAALIVGAVWFWFEATGGQTPDRAGSLVMAAITAGTGLLMVSNIRYYSPKMFNIRHRVPFISMVIVVIVFGVALLDPPSVLLGVFVLYALSGPANILRRFIWPEAAGKDGSG